MNIGARVLGREIRKIIEGNQKLPYRLQQLLEQQMKNPNGKGMLQSMDTYCKKDNKTNYICIENLLQRLRE